MTDDGRAEPDGERTGQDRDSGGLAALFLGVDAVMAAIQPTARGVIGVASFALIMFSLGVAAGTYGVQGDVEELRGEMTEARAARTDLRSNIERNESDIAALGAVVTQADINAFRSDFSELREAVRRIDRVICSEVELEPASVCAAR